MKNKGFKNFILSLYKPVKFLVFVMLISMVISQILNLVKQYIIKNIIDMPSANGFEIADLYEVMIVLLVVIVLEIIFFYVSNIIRTIYVLKKQTPYISVKLFRHLNSKTYPFFVDNYTGKISTAINQINDETIELNTLITTKFISLLTSMISSLVVLYTIDINIFITATILFAGIIITRIIYFSKKYLPLIKEAEINNREYSGILNDAVLNFTSLRLYNAVENFSKTLKGKKEEVNQYKNRASTKEFSFGAVANVAYVITLAILMWYSIRLFSNNLMSLGNFVFFINAMISIKSETTSFTCAYIHIGETLVKMKNNYELLYADNNVKDNNKADIKKKSGDNKFDNVSFRYNKK